jgi:hypothetical protein
MKTTMKKQSKIKRQHIILLLMGLALNLHVALSIEITEALRHTNDFVTGGVAMIHHNATNNNTLTVNTPILEANQRCVPGVLTAHVNIYTPGLNLSEKDLLFAGGGFGGDPQKIIPMKGGMSFLIICAIGYALMKRWLTCKTPCLE